MFRLICGYHGTEIHSAGCERIDICCSGCNAVTVCGQGEQRGTGVSIVSNRNQSIDALRRQRMSKLNWHQATLRINVKRVLNGSKIMGWQRFVEVGNSADKHNLTITTLITHPLFNTIIR